MIKVIPKPWGQEEVLHIDDRYMMKRLTMNAGHRCSLQFHEKKTETVYVLSGKLRVLIGPNAQSLETKLMQAGDVITILPHQVHRMEGVETAVYLEASTPEMEDVVRLTDDYQRAGT